MMSPEQQALSSLLASFLDLKNGYHERELHEPWQESARRAYKLLPPDVQADFNVDEDTMQRPLDEDSLDSA